MRSARASLVPAIWACVAALAEVRQSLDLDPDQPDARAILGYILFAYQWDWPGSEREFQRSLDLNPSSLFALTYYARFLAAQGRFDDALSYVEKAKRLDPQSGSVARDYALFLYYKGDLAAAEQALREPAAMENNQPGLPLTQGLLAEARGDLEGALADTRQALRLTSGAIPLRVVG